MGSQANKGDKDARPPKSRFANCLYFEKIKRTKGLTITRGDNSLNRLLFPSVLSFRPEICSLSTPGPRCWLMKLQSLWMRAHQNNLQSYGWYVSLAGWFVKNQDSFWSRRKVKAINKNSKLLNCSSSPFHTIGWLVPSNSCS